MVDDAVAAIGVLLWIVALLQTRQVLLAHDHGARLTLASTTVALAVCATFFTTAVNRWISELSGATNIAEPIARTALLVAAWTAPVLLAQTARPALATRTARRGGGALLLAAAVVWSCYVLSPAGSALRSLDRAVPVDLWSVIYHGVVLAYLVQALARVAFGAWRYAGLSPAPLRTGLALIAAGCLVGVGYAVVRLATLAASIGSTNAAAVEVQALLGRSLAVAAGLLVVAGCVWPSLVRNVLGLIRWWWSWRAHQRLYPMWAASHAALPELALDPPRGRLHDAMRSDVQFRLYRRVVELRDTLHAVFPDLDRGSPSLPPRAPGQSAPEVDALEQRMRRALTSHLADGGQMWPDAEVSDPDRQEVQWWLQIANHFPRSSPSTTRHRSPATRTRR